MHRTPSEGSKMPPPRVLPALLLLLFVTAPPLLCSATVSSSSSSIATQIAAFPTSSNRTLPDIIRCYPGVILFDSDKQYRCEVSDPNRLNGLNLCMVNSDTGKPRCTWSATISNNIITFKAGGSWGSEGYLLFAFGSPSESSVTVWTNYTKLYFQRYGETRAHFTVPNPYYGMLLSLWVGLPPPHVLSGYLLIDSNAKCPIYREKYSRWQSEMYYEVTNMRLPPPGSYKLCVTGKDWNDRLLPWGAATELKTSALVATPLTLTNGIVPSITLHNGDTGAVVTLANISMFLVRCAAGTCPSVTPLRGEKLISLIACNEFSPIDRVELSSSALNAPAGTYALCVMDGNNKFSPAALPVTVLQDPFTMEVSGASKGSVRLRVSGGDLATRTEPYEVCIVENGASCDTVTSGSTCTRSSEPNAETLDVDVSKVAGGKTTFCLVVKRATYNGYIYMDVQPHSDNVVVHGNQQGGGGEKMLIWLPILVVLLFALAVCGAIFAVRHWRRRKGYTGEKSELDAGDRGDGFYSYNAPYGNQSEYAFDEGMSDAMERESERASSVQH